MSHQAKREVFRAIYWRYRKASRWEKAAILSEFCRTCGYSRKYAIRKLGGPPPEERKQRRRPGRQPTYPEEVIEVLAEVWQAAGYPCSARLKPLLEVWRPFLLKRFRLDRKPLRLLFQISGRQIDRRLQSRRRRLKRRLYGRTKPGTLLKHHIPLRTDRWDVSEAGWTEIDLVSHGGGSERGEFLHSLNATDIASAWTEARAVMGKSQLRVQQALEDIRQALPFSLLGVDSDNGSEFINDHLLRYCQGLDIQFTRGRPYKKDDNAHIEQKNWTHVRKLLGYVRYDSQAALEAINDLYRNELSWFQNFFQPSTKLLGKQRVGSRLRRRHDVPKTPFQRLCASHQLSPAKLRMLKKRMRSLDPFELSKTIDRKLERIYQLANHRVTSAHGATRVK